MEGMTKAQQEFLDESTRRLMADWAFEAMTDGGNTFVRGHGNKDPFIQYALTKKWISAVSNQGDDYTYKVLSVGWETASRYLRR